MQLAPRVWIGDTALRKCRFPARYDGRRGFGVLSGWVAFVGGSVVAKGGHNPLEPAQFGVPVVMGPSYENFKEIVGAMRQADAIRIAAREELSAAFVELLTGRE